MKLFRATALASALVLAIGCQTLEEGGSSSSATTQPSLCRTGRIAQAINSTGPVPEGCVRIEGEDIGKLPLTLNVGGVTVTITSWTSKDEEPDEQVGFTFTTSGGSVAYAVKASGETFAGTSNRWIHPNGTSSNAHAISNITFCVQDSEDGGVDEGGNTPASDGGIDEGGENGAPDAGSEGGESGTPDAGLNEGGENGTPDAGLNEGGDSGEECTPEEDRDPPVLIGVGAGQPCSTGDQCLSGECSSGLCERSESRPSRATPTPTAR